MINWGQNTYESSYMQNINFKPIRSIIHYEKWAKNMNRKFTERDIQIPLNHVKRYKTSFMIKIQIKTIIKYSFFPYQIGKNKNSGNIAYW